jgi:hypothetical protein
MCKNYFSHLLNVHNVSDVRLIAINTAESLVPGHITLVTEICIAKLKKYTSKSPGNEQILEN